jgi:hypothetical protein
VEPEITNPLAFAKALASTIPNATQAEYDLNLMKVYRYQIAPWVSIPKVVFKNI